MILLDVITLQFAIPAIPHQTGTVQKAGGNNDVEKHNTQFGKQRNVS